MATSILKMSYLSKNKASNIQRNIVYEASNYLGSYNWGMHHVSGLRYKATCNGQLDLSLNHELI